MSAQADSTEFLHGNRRSVSDLDLLDKPPSLSSSVSSLSDHSHLDDLIAFTSGVLKGQGQINGKGGQPEALIYKCEAKANQGARGRTHPPKPSRAFQKANSVPLIQVSEVKGGYQHLVYNECERNGNPNYVNVPIATNTLNVDKEMDRPPSEYLFRDVVIEERNGNQDLKTRNEGREETKTESLPVDSVQTNGSVVTNGDLNGNVDGVKIVVNSASKTLDAKQTILTQPPVPVPPPLPSIIATSEIVANGHNTAPPAPPPPPPPAIPSQPPPTSRAQTTPQLVNGVTPTTASGADNSVKPPRYVPLSYWTG